MSLIMQFKSFWTLLYFERQPRGIDFGKNDKFFNELMIDGKIHRPLLSVERAGIRAGIPCKENRVFRKTQLQNYTENAPEMQNKIKNPDEPQALQKKTESARRQPMQAKGTCKHDTSTQKKRQRPQKISKRNQRPSRKHKKNMDNIKKTSKWKPCFLKLTTAVWPAWNSQFLSQNELTCK